MWVKDAHAGGVKIPPAVAEQTKKAIEACWRSEFRGLFKKVFVRFKGHFCYIDGDVGEPVALQLCRLRHFRPDSWSVDLYNYSSETYDPAPLPSGEDSGPAVEGFRLAASFLAENGP